MSRQDALRAVLELLEKATPGPWEAGVEGNGKPGWVYCDNALGSAVAIVYDDKALPFSVFPRVQEKANAAIIAAAVNFLREHGPAMLSGGGDAEDAARYRVLRPGRSDVHGDCYVMVFAGDGDYPVKLGELDCLADRMIRRAAMPTTPEATQ